MDNLWVDASEIDDDEYLKEPELFINRFGIESNDKIYEGVHLDKGRYLFNKACVIGYKIGVAYISIVIDVEYLNINNQIIFDGLLNEYFKKPHNILSKINDNKYLVLFNIKNSISKNCNQDELIVYLEDFSRKIKNLGVNVLVALGSISNNASEYYRSIYDAEMALRFLKKNDNKKIVGSIEDYYLDEIFLSADRKTCKMFVGRLIDKLLLVDNDEILINTIKVYCEEGFRKSAASNILNIHRNTLEYRLKKIEAILNIKSTDYKIFLQMYIGILIMKSYSK